MAGFFSLGGGGGGGGREETSNHEYHHHHHHQENTSTHDWFLYKNHDQELPTYKGFELWQQQQQQQQQQSHNDDEQNYQILRNPIINPFGLGHDHHHHGHGLNMMMMRSSSTISISCQDCGNQAKKDCQHMRCRTCCKSRGFQCQTHVKSTWVPAAKRRERQQQLAALQQKQEDNNKSKRQKDDTINTGFEVTNNFPSKVNSTAMFQRVRLSSIEENEDQIAYQAVVNINGHIFKGILYDQGDDNHEYNYMNGGDSSSGGDPMPCQHNLNITGTATSDTNNAAAGCGGATSAEAAEGLHFLETSLYSSAPLINTFVGGTQFFPHPRS